MEFNSQTNETRATLDLVWTESPSEIEGIVIEQRRSGQWAEIDRLRLNAPPDRENDPGDPDDDRPGIYRAVLAEPGETFSMRIGAYVGDDVAYSSVSDFVVESDLAVDGLVVRQHYDTALNLLTYVYGDLTNHGSSAAADIVFDIRLCASQEGCRTGSRVYGSLASATSSIINPDAGGYIRPNGTGVLLSATRDPHEDPDVNAVFYSMRWNDAPAYEPMRTVAVQSSNAGTQEHEVLDGLVFFGASNIEGDTRRVGSGEFIDFLPTGGSNLTLQIGNMALETKTDVRASAIVRDDAGEIVHVFECQHSIRDHPEWCFTGDDAAPCLANGGSHPDTVDLDNDGNGSEILVSRRSNVVCRSPLRPQNFVSAPRQRCSSADADDRETCPVEPVLNVNFDPADAVSVDVRLSGRSVADDANTLLTSLNLYSLTDKDRNRDGDGRALPGSYASVTRNDDDPVFSVSPTVDPGYRGVFVVVLHPETSQVVDLRHFNDPIADYLNDVDEKRSGLHIRQWTALRRDDPLSVLGRLSNARRRAIKGIAEYFPSRNETLGDQHGFSRVKEGRAELIVGVVGVLPSMTAFAASTLRSMGSELIQDARVQGLDAADDFSFVMLVRWTNIGPTMLAEELKFRGEGDPDVVEPAVIEYRF